MPHLLLSRESAQLTFKSALELLLQREKLHWAPFGLINVWFSLLPRQTSNDTGMALLTAAAGQGHSQSNFRAMNRPFKNDFYVQSHLVPDHLLSLLQFYNNERYQKIINFISKGHYGIIFRFLNFGAKNAAFTKHRYARVYSIHEAIRVKISGILYSETNFI